MDFDKLIEEARKMSEQMAKAREDVVKQVFTGEASNGLVKVTMNGAMEVLKIELDPSVIDPNEKEMLEELLVIAVSDVIKQVQKVNSASLSELTQGLDLEGI